MIVGPLHYGDRAYDALAIAATGNAAGIVDDAQRKEQADSEFMHNVYQAVCRCRVRIRDGGKCGAANAYFIMPYSDDRRELMRRAFPGCSIERWMPKTKAKRKKADEVLEFVISMMKSQNILSFEDVAVACGSSRGDFLNKTNRQVRVKDELKKHGIHIIRRHYIRYIGLLAAA